MSRWKAGQCVTIKGKRYRIVKKNGDFVNCLQCSLFDADNSLCYSLCEKSTAKVPENCYLKEIKPKS